MLPQAPKEWKLYYVEEAVVVIMVVEVVASVV
jgi:hypothetical protein